MILSDFLFCKIFQETPFGEEFDRIGKNIPEAEIWNLKNTSKYKITTIKSGTMLYFDRKEIQSKKGIYLFVKSERPDKL